MKPNVLFIPAKSKAKVNPAKISELSSKLPNSIAIAYSIQFQDIAKEIKKILEKTHKITAFTQVLGCSKPVFKDTQAILLIGSGKFHAVSLAYETQLLVYILNSNKLEQVSQSDLDIIAKKQKAAYLKFLNADKVGILVSTKPGQDRLKKALELKNKLQGKKSYVFLSNAINIREFENFPDIQSWVNTACPRMDMDNSAIINVDKLE